jgi:hypothetical protein
MTSNTNISHCSSMANLKYGNTIRRMLYKGREENL